MDAGGTRDWARSHFADAELGDRRRTGRLVAAAARIAERPAGSLPSKFDWPELKAVYRLCDAGAVTHDAVQAPHRARVREAMAAEPVALILHDTTTLDFLSHRALAGAGPTGDGVGRGFLQHNSLAVTPAGAVLGLAHQRIAVRREAPDGECSAARKRRTRESDLWRDGIAGVGRPPEGAETLWVDVADAGADAFEVMAASLAAGHAFLIRVAQHDRVVYDRRDGEGTGEGDEGRRTHVGELARSLAPAVTDTVEIAARRGRRARTATVRLAAAAITVPPPRLSYAPRPAAIAATLIRVWEPDPPAGVTPIEWRLLCSLPGEHAETLKTRRDWYARRWLVEQFHQIEKTGCGEEDLRFETAERMGPMLGVISIVATRVLQLQRAARATPEAPARTVATAEQIAVVEAAVTDRAGGRKRPPPIASVRDYVRGVALLGGFLGRKSDGEPGWQTLWRGHRRIEEILLGVRLSEAVRTYG